MPSPIRTTLTALALVGSTFIAGVQASDSANVTEKTKAEPRSEIAQLLLAQELYGYGVVDNDPILVIAASRLAASVPSRTVDLASETEDWTEGASADADNPEGSPDTNVPTLAEMIATARRLAGDQSVYHAMLDDIEATKSRGVVGKARSAQKVIGGKKRHRYRGNDTTFEGGKRAEVGIVGNGSTDLDLYVFDENGNEICKSISRGDREKCSWRPRWTGFFTVYVVNRGSRAARYAIYTN